MTLSSTGAFVVIPLGVIPAEIYSRGPLFPGYWDLIPIDIPSGIEFARFSLFDAYTDAPGQYDLDLMVTDASGNLIGLQHDTKYLGSLSYDAIRCFPRTYVRIDTD